VEKDLGAVDQFLSNTIEHLITDIEVAFDSVPFSRAMQYSISFSTNCSIFL